MGRGGVFNFCLEFWNLNKIYWCFDFLNLFIIFYLELSSIGWVIGIGCFFK